MKVAPFRWSNSILLPIDQIYHVASNLLMKLIELLYASILHIVSNHLGHQCQTNVLENHARYTHRVLVGPIVMDL